MSTVTAKVFKAGNSKAVRLPAFLNIKAKTLVIEQKAGRIIMYDPAERERERKRRLAAMKKLAALGPLPEGVEFERP